MSAVAELPELAPKTGVNFVEDIMAMPIGSPLEFLAVRNGGTIIELSSGQQRRVKEIFWTEKRLIFSSPYIVIEDEDTDTMEVINTAHIISIK